MAQARCGEGEFIDLYQTLGASGTARKLEIEVRKVHARRQHIEKKRRITLTGPNPQSVKRLEEASEYPHRLKAKVYDGVVLVGSDAHYWPGLVTTAHRGLVRFAKMLKPQLVVMNGDALDFPAISRFHAGSWSDLERRPKVVDEIEAAQERLHEIVMAYPKARHVHPLGNHDARLETKLLTQAPEYAGVKGTRLKDHFPEWEPCWSIWVNEEVVIKHRFKGGVYAARNNTLLAGKSFVGGHLHSQKVWPHDDYNGTRWGVDCGTMAEPYGPQFVDYTEDSPKDWRSGFIVLYFDKGRLLQPQPARVMGEGLIDFCGEAITV